MSTLGTRGTRSAPGPDGDVATGQMLLRAFHEVRDELVSTLLYLLGNWEDAQDAAQDCFLKCWRTQESLPAVQNLRAWIFRVALNTAKDMQRSAWRRRTRPLPEEEIMQVKRTDAPGQGLVHQETLARLRLAIQELRPDEKEVFLLRQNGELTYEQIAEMRKTPVGTVKTQMRSALLKLRKLLA